MNKSVKTIIIISVIILLVIALFVVVLKLNAKPKTNLEPINSNDDLLALVDKLYEGQENLFSSLQSQVVDISDDSSVKYYTGLNSGDNFEYMVASEPLMSSQAYSLVLAKVKDGVDVDAVAKEMFDNVDTVKWICVSAEKLYVTSSGNVICLIMTNEEMATPIFEKFKSLAGNLNELYEKTEEEQDFSTEVY